MKLFSATAILILLTFGFTPVSIYDYSFTKIEGGTQVMSAYQGKKILIITLPVQQSSAADSMLYSLDTLAAARINSLAVIAVPAYEDGYTPSQQASLTQWYRSKLGNYISISEGLYTRKTSGSQQHILFKWLTTVSMNEDFDLDVTGPNFKFFVSSTGSLYGVLTPQTRVGGTTVQRTLQIQ